MKVTYRVKPRTSYVVTRTLEGEGNLGAGEVGTFNSEIEAYNAALAFATRETALAQPPDIVVGPDGAEWQRKTGRWSTDPSAE